MPLRRDPLGGGLHADGSSSTMYCSYCFEGGYFKQPNWTAGQMQRFAKDKLREMGFPQPLAWLFTRQIPKLERWKRTTI